MSDQIFMFAVVIGVFVALTAGLFASRAKRYSSGFKPASEQISP